MKTYHWMSVLLSIILAAGLVTAIFSTVTAADKAQTGLPPEITGVEDALTTGLQQAVLQRQDKALAFVIYKIVVDHVELRADQQQAVLWLALAEREGEHILATEPGLAIANLTGTDPNDPAAWQFTLQVDEDWKEKLSQLASELITADQRENFMSIPAGQQPGQQIEAIGGYHLPWANGRSKMLEGSIGHFLIYYSCNVPSDCYYSYDFADGTMFPLVAARGGTVYTYYDECANGNHYCSNYIVLKDTSTSPATYQLYLHIAYHSVPSRLRSIGTSVQQGEYIANVDDTGYSTGHHLHFQVFTYFTTSYWGPSVDITFDEVNVNGGRPRTCYESENWPGYGDECVPGDWYVSNNATPYPPSGGISAPAPFSKITSPSLTINGWSNDREDVAQIWVKGLWNGTWHTMAQFPKTGFPAALDLCELGVPNGLLDVALTIEDLEGNRIYGTGRRTLLVNKTCPADTPAQPACQPGASQVAIYSDANYQGECILLDTGTYNSPGEFGDIGNNNIESVQVGSSVRAVLFSNGYFADREESLEISDPNLADNRIQANTISSLKVVSRSALPAAPQMTAPAASATSSLVFTWKGQGGIDYKAELFGPNNPALLAASRAYAPSTSWSVGTLAGGTYTLKVTARNSAGTTSAQTNVSITAASLPTQSTQNLPYVQNFEAGAGWWFTSQPYWQWADTGSNHAWVFGNEEVAGITPKGDLTSPPITLPASPASELRFRFFADTEDTAAFWDQMRVQVAPVGEPFRDIYQIQAHAENDWLQSPALNLAAYAGQTIRIRFHFDAVDDVFNNNPGWVIDDVRVQAFQPPACSEAAANDTWQTATVLSDSFNGVICPNGDVDFYKINGTAGGHLGVNVTSTGLVPALSLYDATGGLLLDGGSPLRMILPRTGVYYVRVRSQFHPDDGGDAYAYTIQAAQETTPPAISIAYPTDSIIPENPFYLTTQASDAGGVTSVAFYWHNATWPGSWQLLGIDTNGADGWKWWVDPAALPGISGGAFYVSAEDSAGNAGVDWRLNLTYDVYAPTAQIQPLVSPHLSTAIRLRWSGSDIGYGIDHYELQYRLSGNSWWGTLADDLPASANEYWFVGRFENSYDFRLRPVDLSGNIGTSNSVTTIVESDCTPDAFEDGDDSIDGAIALTWWYKGYNLCALADRDYRSITGTPGKPLVATVLPVNGGAAVTLQVIQSGVVIASSSATGPNQPTAVRWWPVNNSPSYVKVVPLGFIAGTEATYFIRAFEPFSVYLPVVIR